MRFYLNSIFTDKDRQQMSELGISESQVSDQLIIFREGIPAIKLQKPCTVGDGIITLKNSDVKKYSDIYTEAQAEGRAMKFVPASGAATRMFKLLIKFNQKLNKIDKAEIEKEASKENNHKELLKFIERIRRFAFFNDLKEVLSKKGIDIEDRIQQGKFKEIVNALISEDGLNYAELPKGLIKFHKYNSTERTAFEEHLVETAAYCKDKDGKARIHFTISLEHDQRILTYIESIRNKYEDDIHFDIKYSFQNPATNTIAVDMQNNPFRLDDGSILFRPGGHGALLENLNNLNGDIVFMKNIDNVVPDRLKGETYKYKRILGGLLVELQQNVFKYLQKLNNGENNSQLINEVMEFSRNELSVIIPKHINNASNEEQKQFLINKLNRPTRVCGIVKNEGEPGGGPFWVEDKNGNFSLQVVEAAQVDNKPEQKEIWQSATHFSPTDFVCAVRDFNGNPFNLMKYRDPDAGFITKKSQDGRDLKALELPGLWNGSMAFWNTIFVEVPIITFNPVKTILDLLRPNHQPVN